jgi:hypothetical protein
MNANEWQGVGYGYDNHSVFQDPLFANPNADPDSNDFYLQYSNYEDFVLKYTDPKQYWEKYKDEDIK